MKKKFVILVSIFFIVSLFTMPVFAFDVDEEVVTGPSAASPFPPQSIEPNVFGTYTNILQIPASSFIPRLATEPLEYYNHGYVQPPTSITGEWWATVTLPAGANISYLDLYYYDTNATYDVTAYLRGFYGGAYGATVGSNWIAEVSSYGSDGYGYVYSDYFSHTVNNDVAYGDGHQYVVIINFPVADGTLKFKGVDIWWNRQISPAPSTATFSDVPTSHPFFQYVEALVDSGITAGCGGGNYCPDAPLTRGQMAVFLSKALGLHWPY